MTAALTRPEPRREDAELEAPDRGRGRTLLFHQAALGDFVLMLSLVRSLLAADEDAAVTLVVPWKHHGVGRALLGEDTRVRYLDVELFEFTRMHATPGPSILSPALRDDFAEAERVVTLLGGHAGPGDAWHGNIRRLSGLPSNRIYGLPTRPDAAAEHLTATHRRLLRQRGLVLDAQDADVEGEDGRGPAATSQLPPPQPPRRLIVHPGAGSPMKQWAPAHFEQLIAAAKDRGVEVRCWIGEAEQATWPAEKLTHWQNRHDAETLTSTADLVRALQELDVETDHVVGNDSGPAHVAAALGLATTAVFGPTDPAAWAPRGPRSVALGGGVAGWPDEFDVIRRVLG